MSLELCKGCPLNIPGCS